MHRLSLRVEIVHVGLPSPAGISKKLDQRIQHESQAQAGESHKGQHDSSLFAANLQPRFLIVAADLGDDMKVTFLA